MPGRGNSMYKSPEVRKNMVRGWGGHGGLLSHEA